VQIQVHNPSIAMHNQCQPFVHGPPHPAVLSSFPCSRRRFFPTLEMADQSGSARFQTPSFESALQVYEEKTGVTLAQHPLTLELQSCQSTHDLSTLLQGRAQAFGNSRARDRMMKAIKTTVSLLTRLGHAAPLAESVRQKVLMACSTSLTLFFRHHFHLRRQYMLALVYYWMYVPFSNSCVDPVVTSR
jgi:hypothetical protein